MKSAHKTILFNSFVIVLSILMASGYTMMEKSTSHLASVIESTD